jgi:hypothetical protein
VAGKIIRARLLRAATLFHALVPLADGSAAVPPSQEAGTGNEPAINVLLSAALRGLCHKAAIIHGDAQTSASTERD